MAFTGTPAAEKTEAIVRDLFGHLILGIGQYNRRLISGTSIWSQHSWGNGLDIMLGGSLNTGTPTGLRNGDVIAKFLNDHREEFGIRAVLWRVKNHFNHIHVDFWPKGVYTPPTDSSGKGYFRYSDGRQTHMRIQYVKPEGSFDGYTVPELSTEEVNVLQRGDEGNAVKKFQQALMAERPGSLPKWKDDSDFGAETEAAVIDYQRRIGLPQNGIIDGVVGALLLEYMVDRVDPEPGGSGVDQEARNAAQHAIEQAAVANSRLAKVKAVL